MPTDPLGIATSLEAISRVIGPSLGGYMLQNIARWAPGVFSALLLAWAISFAYRRIIVPSNRLRLEAES
jgi:hypothetical protein